MTLAQEEEECVTLVVTDEQGNELPVVAFDEVEVLRYRPLLYLPGQVKFFLLLGLLIGIAVYFSLR